MAMPCGYGFGNETVLVGVSVTASPMMSLDEPMQVRNQRLLSSENTMSSPTWQSGTATVFAVKGRFDMSMTRSSGFPSAVT